MTREIVNMVASTRYCTSLDINDVADTLNVEYEQEQFPGMVYRVESPKVYYYSEVERLLPQEQSQQKMWNQHSANFTSV